MILSNFLVEMRAMRGKNEKIRHLQRYDSPFFRELMEALFNPFRRFNVSINAKWMKYSGDKDLSEMADEIRNLLLKLELSYSSTQNRKDVLELSKQLDSGSQLFLQAIVNKKAKIGVGQRVILQVFPNLFVPFNPQKGHLYKPDRDYGVPLWYGTPKLNGIRAVCLYRQGFWKLHTYVGHLIHTCEHIIPDLERLRKKFGYTMVDGELYNHKLTFNQIQTAVLTASDSGSGIDADIKLHCFTAGDEKAFSEERVEGFVPMLPAYDGEFLQTMSAIPLESKEEIALFYKECVKLGYEGAVIRNPEKPYDFKKSTAFLKVKKDCFGDLNISDCLVTEIIEGEIQVINNVGGYDYVPAMVALRVQQPDGIICKVGTGFSNAFRLRVLTKDIDILDRVIEVKHEGWGAQGRMIFPVYERLRHYKDKVM